MFLASVISTSCTTTSRDTNPEPAFGHLIATLGNAADKGQKELNLQIVPRVGRDYFINRIDTSDVSIIGYAFNVHKCIGEEMLSQAFQSLKYDKSPEGVPLHGAFNESYATFQKKSSNRVVQVSTDLIYVKATQRWCVSHLFINTREK